MLDYVDKLIAAVTKVREVAKKSRNAELLSAIADLTLDTAQIKMEMAALRNENTRIREERDELRRRVDLRDKVKLSNGLYFLAEPVTGYGSGPFCPVCFDADSKLITLTAVLQQSQVTKTLPLPVQNGWRCGACKSLFNYVDGSVS